MSKLLKHIIFLIAFTTISFLSIAKSDENINLPNNINKRQYKHHLINHTDIDLKKNLIKTHTKNILVGYDGIPYCVIS